MAQPQIKTKISVINHTVNLLQQFQTTSNIKSRQCVTKFTNNKYLIVKVKLYVISMIKLNLILNI